MFHLEHLTKYASAPSGQLPTLPSVECSTWNMLGSSSVGLGAWRAEAVAEGVPPAATDAFTCAYSCGTDEARFGGQRWLHSLVDRLTLAIVPRGTQHRADRS